MRELEQGAIAEYIRDGVAVYLGLPYAAAPVGPRRLRAPEAAPSWSGVRDARRFGPAAPQSALVNGFLAPQDETADGDSWLTANVWRPAGPETGLPVIVFVYGGAYMSGGASNPTYDGTRLSREGGLVVVTFDYRVGPEGFAALDGFPLNRGLLDQVAALRWVRDNISAFGGDPARVTLIGQSAGAGSVACLLASPAIRGLISGAVLHSIPRTTVSPELAERVATDLLSRLDRLHGEIPDPSALAALGDRLVRSMATQDARWGVLAATPSPWAPVVDGDLLPDNPWRAVAAGAVKDIPVIVGHTRDEFRLFRALAGRLDNPGDAADEAALQTFAPPAGATAFRSAHPDLDLGDAAELVRSDYLFRMPSLAFARSQQAAGGRVFLFELTQPVTGTGLGAPHSSDMPLLFGNFVGGSARFPYEDRPSPASVAAGQAMRAAWARFAHSGAPGWPEFETENGPTLVLGQTVAVEPYPERLSADLWAGDPMATLDAPDLGTHG